MSRLGYILTLLFILCSKLVNAQGYQIDIALEHLENDTVYLAYHYGNKQFIRDTLIVDDSGQVTIRGDEPLDGGVYLLVMPDMRYFEFLVDNDQTFGIQVDVQDFMGSLTFSGSPQNTLFLTYQKFLRNHNAQIGLLPEKQKELVLIHPDSVMVIQDEIDHQNFLLQQFQDSIHRTSSGTLISDLIHAMAPPDIPEFSVEAEETNPDSVRMLLTYAYMRDHFFDRTNFNNPKLIRTPILFNKLNNYFNRILVQNPDSVIPQVDKVVKLAEGDPEMFQYVVVFLLNNFLESKIMGMDAVFVYVAESYYLSGRANWVDSDFIDKLNDRIMKMKPSLIGQKGADLKMETISGEWVALHEVRADYTLLYFWEPNCGFCKEATPKLYELYEKYRSRGLAVFAVDTQAKRAEWEDYINEYGLDWINAWDPDHATFFRFYYDVYSTPTLYLLDKDKTIIAKRIDIEALDQMLDQLIGRNPDMD